MRKEYTHKKLQWIDLESPTNQEIVQLLDEFDLPSEAGDYIRNPQPRTLGRVFPGMVFATLHFPKESRGDSTRTIFEIDFIILKHALITIHDEPHDVLHEFGGVFSTQSDLDRFTFKTTGAHLFFSLMHMLYRHVANETDELAESLERVEARIYEGKEKQMVPVIAKHTRILLRYQRSLRFHRSVFERIRDKFLMFGSDAPELFDQLFHTHAMLMDSIDSQKDILDDIRTTGDLLLSTRTNHIIRVITVVVFTTLPFTLTGQFLSIGFKLPFVDTQTEAVSIFILSILAGVIMFIYFRVKRWM